MATLRLNIELNPALERAEALDRRDVIVQLLTEAGLRLSLTQGLVVLLSDADGPPTAGEAVSTRLAELRAAEATEPPGMHDFVNVNAPGSPLCGTCGMMANSSQHRGRMTRPLSGAS